jgi:hypothetical protein
VIGRPPTPLVCPPARPEQDPGDGRPRETGERSRRVVRAMRRAVLLLVVVTHSGCEKDSASAVAPSSPATTSMQARAPADAEPRFVAPPAETDAQGEAIARARAAIVAAQGDSSVALRDRTYDGLHPLPSFRALVREHARAARLTIVADDEAGTPIVARGIVVDAHGKPRANVLVYVYQTDARGWYAADAPHVSGNSGDARHARIFGYVRTDANGAFEVSTVHPIGYPRTDLPAHIHVEITQDDEALAVTEMLFPDDDRLTPDARARGERDGFVVATKADGAVPVYTATFATR